MINNKLSFDKNLKFRHVFKKLKSKTSEFICKSAIVNMKPGLLARVDTFNQVYWRNFAALEAIYAIIWVNMSREMYDSESSIAFFMALSLSSLGYRLPRGVWINSFVQ